MNSFYEELVNKKGIDKLLKESSKKKKDLETEVNVVPYDKKEVTKIEREQSYEALKITRKNILEGGLTGGKYAIKGVYETVKFPFMMPTAYRKCFDFCGDHEDIGLFGLMVLGAACTIGMGIGGVLELGLPAIIFDGVLISTNTLNGFYEYYRYNKNKLKKGGKNE